MVNSRAKGANGEREVARIMAEKGGFTLERNLNQAREGGFDLLGLNTVAIEVKRYRNLTRADLKRFWKQAVNQGRAASRTPVLIYRGDRDEWRVVLPVTGKGHSYDNSAEISINLFCEWLKDEQIQSGIEIDRLGRVTTESGQVFPG